MTTVNIAYSLLGSARYYQANQTWATIVAGAGNQVGAEYEMNYVQSGHSSNTWSNINRYFTLFNTASLINRYITAATLNLRIINLSDSNKINCTYGVYASNPTSTSSIVASDYASSHWGSILLSNTHSITELWEGGWVTFTLNAAGIAQINKSGITKLGIRMTEDVTGIPPTWVEADAYSNAWVFTASEVNDPYLAVTYDDTIPYAPHLDIGFVDNLFASTSAITWTPVESELMELNTKRGRMHELDRIEAGTANFTMKNDSGNWWRNNPGGDYFYNVKPLKPIRLSVGYATTTYSLFYGYIESLKPGWVQEEEAGYCPVMELSCVDMFKSFTRYVLSATTPSPLFNSGLSGAMVDDVLDYIGWPATMRAVTTGTCEIRAYYGSTGKNALEYLQSVADSEGGRIYQRGDGFIVFESNQTRTQSPYNTSQVTFADNPVGTEQPYRHPDFLDDDTWIYNDVIVTTATSGVLAEQYDLTLAAEQGLRTLNKSDSLLANVYDAQAQSYELLKRYSDSILRVQNLTVYPQASPDVLYPFVFGADISERITLKLDNPYNPASINTEYHIEGVEHTCSMLSNPGRWETKLQLWDVNQYQYFQCAYSGYIENQSIVSYANCQTASSGLAYNDTTPIKVGQEMSGSAPNQTWYIRRGALIGFDTSGIAATGKSPVEASILIYKSSNKSIDHDFDLTVVDSDSISQPLVNDDYGNLLGENIDYGHITEPTAVTSPIGYQVIPLNAFGYGAINTTGLTWYGLRSSFDIAATDDDASAYSDYVELDTGSSSGFYPVLVVRLI